MRPSWGREAERMVRKEIIAAGQAVRPMEGIGLINRAASGGGQGTDRISHGHVGDNFASDARHDVKPCVRPPGSSAEGIDDRTARPP
jgi:hypothetical protein